MVASNLVIIKGLKATTRNLYGLYEGNDELNDMNLHSYGCSTYLCDIRKFMREK